MGVGLAFECNECQHKDHFSIGSGFFSDEIAYRLYRCPKCDNLSVREETIENGKRRRSRISDDQGNPKCEKCGAVMIPFFLDKRKLACPVCHSQNCRIYEEYTWD